MAPPTLPLDLTDHERATLEDWATVEEPGRSGAGKRALRARIVLAWAAGLSMHAVAERLGVRPSTALKWRDRFVQDRLDGLQDRPRCGAPRRISDDRIADVLLRTSEPTPAGARPWSRRMMASATGLSRSTIHRIWRTFDVVPGGPTRAN